MSSLPDDLKRFLFLVPYAADRPDGVPVSELATALETDPESIGRLLERAIAVGPPDGTPDEMVEVYLEGDRVFAALPQRFLRPPRFSPEELLALRLVLDGLERAELPGLAKEASSLAQKLGELASAPARDRAEPARDRVLVQAEGDEASAHLADLEVAVRERRRARMTYYTASRDVVTEREVSPGGLLQFEGSWYVVAEDERIYKVSRIRALELLEDRHEVCVDLGAAEERLRMRSAPREATLKIGTEAHTLPLISESYFVERVFAARGREIVDAPSRLRDRIASEARMLQKRYEAR